MKLNDCVAGDIVVVMWRDHGTPLHGTEQFVMYFGSMHSERRKKKEPAKAYSAIVELVDPETIEPYTHGVLNELNMFVVENLEVIEIVQRSKYLKLDEEHERRVADLGDVNDPMMRDLAKG